MSIITSGQSSGPGRVTIIGLSNVFPLILKTDASKSISNFLISNLYPLLPYFSVFFPPHPC
nr:MAG TPA: hypothetical protein [Caudoviricetes sp.]